jgi:hypothetical protein
MRTTVWDYAVIGLTTLIVATAFAVRESSAGAAGYGVFVGLILGTLFCTFVHLVMQPVEREVDALRARLTELERRDGTGA